jgi:hypothetical protein
MQFINAILDGITSMSFDQWAIAVTGSLSSWMIHDDRKSWRLWACIFAIVGQPFWFWAAWTANQWGIFVMDVVYSLGWLKGFLKNRK